MHRTGGMIAIAVVNIIFGGVGILNGLYLLLGFLYLTHELWQLGVFAIPIARLPFPLLALATGIVGIVAGIGLLGMRPWARASSLVYSALLIFTCAGSFVAVPIVAAMGTYDVGSLDAYDLARLTLFGAIYVVIPIAYSIVLCVTFYKPARKTSLANDSSK